MKSEAWNDIADSLTQSHAECMKVGMESERERLLPHFAAIFAAYDRAAADPQAVLPSPLMAAIVAARSAVGEIKMASAPVRVQGRPEHDLDIAGRTLRAGT